MESIHQSSQTNTLYYDRFSRSNFYGFGYDESKDDYLVVLVSYISNSDDVLSRLRIFSLRANTWNEIVSPTHLPCSEVPWCGSDYPVVELVFNGAIHWLAFRYEIGFFVAAFHLTERKLLEIPLQMMLNFGLQIIVYGYLEDFSVYGF